MSTNAINYEESCGVFDRLPEEMFQLVLQYLPCEQIDKLRLVNHRFNASCNYILKKAYRHCKQEVSLCCEKSRLRLSHYDKDLDCYTFTRCEYINRIFWFTVNQMLGNTFYLFDYLKGYLDEEYLINGKTIDMVRLVLLFKDMEDPLQFLVEAIIGRGDDSSNMKYFDDWHKVFMLWFTVIKYHGQETKTFYLPNIGKTQAGLELPKYHHLEKLFMYGRILDILSTLLTENLRMEKVHLLLPKKCIGYKQFLKSSIVIVSIPGQDVSWDSDPDPWIFEKALSFDPQPDLEEPMDDQSSSDEDDPNESFEEWSSDGWLTDEWSSDDWQSDNWSLVHDLSDEDK